MHPVAIHDAVQERVIDRPMRIFTRSLGAGAVGGYAVLRVDPAIVVHERAAHADEVVGVAMPNATSSDDVRDAFGGWRRGRRRTPLLTCPCLR